MNKSNLIPIKSSEQARAMGKKGGQAKTEAKKIAARLRELKKKGLTDANAKLLLKFMESPGVTDLQALKTIVSLEKRDMSVEEKSVYARLLMQWRKNRHGSGDKPGVEINLLQENHASLSNVTVNIVQPSDGDSEDDED